VGFVVLREEQLDTAMAEAPWAVVWDVDELYVPDSLYGAGFVSKLLDAVLRHYRTVRREDRKYVEARVEFAGVTGGITPAGRAARRNRAGQLECVREIEFYKSRGFSYVRAEDPKTGAISLRVQL
jgi:GNAT superfamily N-acetyltransferase